MRILLIHQYFLEDESGGGSRWNEMARIWTEAGHEITVLAGTAHYMGGTSDRYRGKNFVSTKNKDGVNIIRCHVSERYNHNFQGRLRAYFSFTFSSIWAGLFYAKEHYDVIVVSSPPLFVGFSALILSLFKRLPFVFEIRDLWPESAIETGVLKNRILIRIAYWFEKLIYKKARLINVLTPAFRNKLVEDKNVSIDKIIYIPNGADFTLSEKILRGFDVNIFRKKHNLENTFVLTYLGAHGMANDLGQILNAAELLQEENICFLLIGGGMKKKELMIDAKSRRLKNIRFIDVVSRQEAFRYILASDMGMSVLKNAEVFKTIYSNKTFDYFSCKKPVLMAIDGISRRLVEDADAGVFVEPENAADFAEKIRYYLKNPDLLQRQGQNGYVYAKKHFDREILAQQFLDYLIRL